jgi:hypothetical protein
VIRKARDLIAQGSPEEVIDYAIDLNRKKVGIEAELDQLKIHLRKLGKERAQGSWSIDLEGLTGIATIVFPAMVVKPKRDLRDLEENLPPEIFKSLFVREVKISPVPVDDFLEKREALSSEHRASLDNFVEVVEATAKVNLPR